METRFCDLHTHSVFSDGTCTPEEIVDLAEAAGLSAVALCDHNTLDGLPRFMAYGKGKRVETVAGGEFSVSLDGKELHLLGLFIPETAFPRITQLMESVNKSKEESNLRMVEALARDGICVDYAAVKAATPTGMINRAHIAAELTRLGYTTSVKHAFDTVLSLEAGYYKEPMRLSFRDMLDVLVEVGAVPVLAHPLLDLSPERLAAFLPLAAEWGLRGMECYYSTYTPEETQICLELAKANRLLVSGGSDFHGGNKPEISLGVGKGDLRIPRACVEGLRP